jgi:hypothetical protein
MATGLFSRILLGPDSGIFNLCAGSIGLWEGVVDPFVDVDGYGVIRSITVNQDDTYTIRGRWSEVIGCVLVGTGVMEGDELVVDDMTQFCTSGTYSMPTTYTFDEVNGTLLEELQQLSSGRTYNSILHKTSR